MLQPAVFTIVQDEPQFFPIWYRHYRRHFLPSEIYVLHHRLPDSGTEAQLQRRETWERFLADHHAHHGYNLITIFNDKSFDHEWLRQTVMHQQRQLLDHHSWTLFAEVDEIIAPHPVTGLDLKGFAASRLDQVCVTNGHEVVHKVGVEPPLDLGKPILMQRGWWYWSQLYSKPLLTRIPLTWYWGFHECVEVPEAWRRRNPDLILLHLHKMDWGMCLERNQVRSGQDWKGDGGGFQNRIVDENSLARWWTKTIDQPSHEVALCQIPPEIRFLV